MARVTFSYDPHDPDPDDPSGAGMSEAEYNELMDKLMAMGAYEIEISGD